MNTSILKISALSIVLLTASHSIVSAQTTTSPGAGDGVTATTRNNNDDTNYSWLGLLGLAGLAGLMGGSRRNAGATSARL